MLFADYISNVVRDYESKRDSNTLSPRLARPTPGNIRDECMAVCEERFQRKDELTLRTFFGAAADKGAYLLAIKGIDIDRFRPLNNFLNGRVTSPGDKNIELLAWLIDYEPRPHDFGRKIEPPKLEPPNKVDGATPVEPPNEEPPPPPSLPEPPPGPIVSTRKVILIGVLLLLIGGAVYWISRSAWGPRDCMYWVNDHYEATPCSKPGAIPLNPEVLNNFKKIMRPDTITEASIGRVYYLRRHGGHEFFTQNGDVPEDATLRLLPLTKYIYDNHIVPLKK